MCDLMVVGAIGLGVSAIGSGVSAYGQHEQGKQAAAAARENARLARLAATDAIQRGQLDAGMARMAGSSVIGEQKVAMGASGVDLSSGTPLALMADSRMMSELDAQTIQNNAMREAWGLKTQGLQYQQQAKAASRAGNLGAAGTLLGGAGQAAAMGYTAFGKK